MYFTLECIVAAIVLFSNEIQCDVIGHIQTLDYVISNSILQPRPGEGEKLSSELLQLYMVLDEIHDMLRDERAAGITIVQKVLDGGGLKFPTIKPNFPSIMRAFNWTVDESKALGTLFKDTVWMWRNVQMGMDIIPTTEIDYNLNHEKDRK
uniref:Dynein heavy chain tail domain-containing protein n=1 Tax=Graphocephala atropunctata TaxID=36148 RepID=A0A1B6MIA3_9HEMI